MVSNVVLTLFQFYHACDQPGYTYCLMPYSVLQFGDFYSALTSVWLTAIIVAEPQVSEQLLSSLYVAGTVGIAMAVHYSATSFASFTIPIVCGLVIIAVSWVSLMLHAISVHRLH